GEARGPIDPTHHGQGDWLAAPVQGGPDRAHAAVGREPGAIAEGRGERPRLAHADLVVLCRPAPAGPGAAPAERAPRAVPLKPDPLEAPVGIVHPDRIAEDHGDAARLTVLGSCSAEYR